MKNAIFSTLYTLGLSAFFPFLVFNNRSNAALPMFLAPIVAAILADILSRAVTFTKDRVGNRTIWLISVFVLLSQVARLTLGLDALGFTGYMALNALYQIFLGLLFAAIDKQGGKDPEIGPAQFFKFGPFRGPSVR